MQPASSRIRLQEELALLTMPIRKKICFIGSGSQAVIALRTLQDLPIDVVLVFADFQDTGVDSWRKSLWKCAISLNYVADANLFRPSNINSSEVCKTVKKCDIDFILSVQCRSLLRPTLITSAKSGALNIHNAPLPLLRGMDPFAWAIHDGLKEFGLSLHQIPAHGVDDGPVCGQIRWNILPNTSAFDLFEKCLGETVGLLNTFFVASLENSAEVVFQDPRFVTYHSMGQFDFKNIQVKHFHQSAVTLSSFIRSRIFPIFQCPFFVHDHIIVKIASCHVSEHNDIGAKPGQILILEPLTIKCSISSICFSKFIIDDVHCRSLSHIFPISIGDIFCISDVA